MTYIHVRISKNRTKLSRPAHTPCLKTKHTAVNSATKNQLAPKHKDLELIDYTSKALTF